MARIPEAEIDRIKREVSIVRLVESYGVKLTGRGDNLLGHCPLNGHSDGTPSFVVSPKKNLWHCMGACAVGGSVIDFVMQADRVSFRQAAESLQKQALSLVAEAAAEPPAPALEPPDEADEAVLARVALEAYPANLSASAEAQTYLEKRGLLNPELIHHFKLGYANRTLGAMVSGHARPKEAALRAQLERVGLYRASHREHLTGCLTIPVRGMNGEVLELYGRRIEPPKRGAPSHLYLPARPDGRRGVFNEPVFQASKHIILCESLVDALSFWDAHHRNVTTAYGVEGFTTEMRAAFRIHGIERVTIAFDADDAGDRAADKIAGLLAEDGIAVFRLEFPRGLDANAYALRLKEKNANVTKAFENLIATAKQIAGPRSVVVAPVAEPLSTSIENPGANEPSPPLVAPLEPTSAELGELRLRFGDRQWRVRGLEKNTSYDSLRINLLVRAGDGFFVDTLELYSARHRDGFVKEAARELKLEERVLKSDLGQVLLRLEDEVRKRLENKLETNPVPTMTDAERAEALALLRDPKLLDRILEAFDDAGVVGEENNKLIGYLAAVSRKLESPLALVIQSSSAAGKSSLMDAVLRFVPEEERVQYSAMTGQSLFYMGETDLSHKILAIAEEQGMQSAAYALKLLQSQGEVSIASTGKDPDSGKLVTHTYRVKGPVMIMLTTTAIEVDEELLNRCLVLTVDEGAAQTSAIHARQREAQTLEGLFRKQSQAARMKLHQDAQRLLEPLHVVNPLAKSLHFSNAATRSRRDHMKYLSLIQAIALLHQHQRDIKEVVHRGERLRYIEVTAEDIAHADRLAKGLLDGVVDDLPPQTRQMLEIIDRLVTEQAAREGVEKTAVRFTRREVRERTRASDTVLKKHLGRLEELEILLVQGGGARRRVLYTLAFDPKLVSLWAPHPLPPGETRFVRGDIEEIEKSRNLGSPRGRPDTYPEILRNSENPPRGEKSLLPGAVEAPRVLAYANGNGHARPGPIASVKKGGN